MPKRLRRRYSLFLSVGGGATEVCWPLFFSLNASGLRKPAAADLLSRRLAGGQKPGDSDRFSSGHSDEDAPSAIARSKRFTVVDAALGQLIGLGIGSSGWTLCCRVAVPAEASISFLQFSCAMIVKPAGRAARPLTWSTSSPALSAVVFLEVPNRTRT